MEFNAPRIRSRVTTLADQLVQGLKVGTRVSTKDLRRIMADPLTVNRTDVAMFLDETMLIVALVGGVRTTMLWKIVRNEHQAVLQRLTKDNFRCRRTTRRK